MSWGGSTISSKNPEIQPTWDVGDGRSSIDAHRHSRRSRALRRRRNRRMFVQLRWVAGSVIGVLLHRFGPVVMQCCYKRLKCYLMTRGG